MATHEYYNPSPQAVPGPANQPEHHSPAVYNPQNYSPQRSYYPPTQQDGEYNPRSTLRLSSPYPTTLPPRWTSSTPRRRTSQLSKYPPSSPSPTFNIRTSGSSIFSPSHPRL
ncbi:hypothetical protein EYC84_000015 [Monilinia fructicola]|uniref:Uncharacterized protein n=1 Tax=Monilinia fructicola TaxID=38448 RepID=A0A5M9JS04_MONFR|nr:hypothetical protein EYC84_000015 [Monilinia fructicola]